MTINRTTPDGGQLFRILLGDVPALAKRSADGPHHNQGYPMVVATTESFASDRLGNCALTGQSDRYWIIRTSGDICAQKDMVSLAHRSLVSSADTHGGGNRDNTGE